MNAIVCNTTNGVIGKDGDLVVRIPEDMKRFKRLTTGHTVIMGSKTLVGIGRLLPNRHNMILSKHLTADIVESKYRPSDDDTTYEICNSVEDVLNTAPADAWVIGGGEVYQMLLPHCDRIYRTQVTDFRSGDVYFPALSEDEWIFNLPAPDVPAGLMIDEEHGDTYRFAIDVNRSLIHSKEELADLLAEMYPNTKDHMDDPGNDDMCRTMSIMTVIFAEAIRYYTIGGGILDTKSKILKPIIRIGYDIWKMVDSRVYELGKTKKPAEVAFFVYIEMIAASSDCFTESDYHDATIAVLEEIIEESTSVDDIEFSFMQHDPSLLKEFFTQFSELGTVYADPIRYTTKEDYLQYLKLCDTFRKLFETFREQTNPDTN